MMMDLKSLVYKSTLKGSSLIESSVLICMSVVIASSFTSKYTQMLKKAVGNQNNVLYKDNQQRVITETMKEINGRIIYDNKITYYREES